MNVNERLELHELLKLAERLDIFWDTKTYEELTQLILQRSDSESILEAVCKYDLDRASPRFYRSLVRSRVSESVYIGWIYESGWEVCRRLRLSHGCIYLPQGVLPSDLGLVLLGDQPATSTPQRQPDGDVR